jgi:hypothetical protein
LVISTNAGLWRYIIGDTVRFTSKAPHRFKITGRTKSFINAFGEELVVENAEMAISNTCKKTKTKIVQYTVAPIYMEGGKRGAHEWLIEFKDLPEDMDVFAHILDGELRALNSDYEAKRTGGMALSMPVVHAAEEGLFDRWLKSTGKLGGQHKVPRLSNDRKIMEEVKGLSLIAYK